MIPRALIIMLIQDKNKEVQKIFLHSQLIHFIYVVCSEKHVCEGQIKCAFKIAEEHIIFTLKAKTLCLC